MGTRVSLESMYDLGYQDALEDIREIIDNMLRDIPESDTTRISYYTGMKVALHGIAEKTWNMKSSVTN